MLADIVAYLRAREVMGGLLGTIETEAEKASSPAPRKART
jgi:hypothetical protein